MSHFITRGLAHEMIQRFERNKNTVIDSAYHDKNVLCNCETFDRAAIDAIMGQQDCVKLRIYYGMDEGYKVHAILMGVNSENENILPPDYDTDNEQIAEMAVRCPDVCPPSAP